ncbi:MAG: ATP-grasp domain-containing protein [Armatimonas sp.]
MKPTAYILVTDDGMPYSVNGAAAAKGFDYMGYEVRPFRHSELDSLELTPDTPVIGGMGTVKAALARLGVQPAHVSVPACLYPFAGRRVWRATVADVLAAGDYPVFVKPYEDLKVFSGTVVTSEDNFEALIAAQPGRPELAPDFPLFCQESVKLVSEWRAFVLRGRVLGLSHYSGDPLVFQMRISCEQQ